MYLIISPYQNIAQNLALEEYLLKEMNDDVVLIYRNKPVVVIGKHQNPYKESNIAYLLEKNTPLCRRLTGGGSVYHDLGNYNYSVIASYKGLEFPYFTPYVQMIINFIESFGPKVFIGERNSLYIGKKKFSGHAHHANMKIKRFISHGTLLFHSDLNMLEKALYRTQNIYHDKSIASIRSNVLNLIDVLPIKNILDFENELIHYFVHKIGCQLSDAQEFNIENLTKKYEQDEWNFGYSPRYKFQKQSILNKDDYLKFEVKKGKIQNLETNIREFLALEGRLHSPTDMASFIKEKLLKADLLFELL